jgi:hypothetical protein
MTFSNFPNTFYRFGMIICVFAIAPFAMQAQQKVLWEAAVTPSELNVYTDPSTTARVAMVLKQNYWVNVILELDSSGIGWCRIEMPGEAEPTGYVFCKDLQQRSAPQKASMNSDSNEGSPRRNEGAAIASPPSSMEKAPTTARALTSADILSMIKAGLPSSVLVAKIKSSACNFDTSPAQLQQLKAGGVPDDVILAMVEAPVGETPVRETKQETADAPIEAPSSAATAEPPTPTGPVTAQPTGKPRVYISSASKGSNRNADRDQSMEMAKDFERGCPDVRITISQNAADYTILLNHIEHGLLVRDNQIQVANKDGDLISTTKEGGSIKGDAKKACELILADWAKK